jgi:hypothetical protein
MRRCRTRVSVLLSVLLLVLLVPSASAGVVRTDYSAFQFPMGFPGTELLGYPPCPYAYATFPFPACVKDPGTVTHPGHGRWTIRDMVLLQGVLPTSDPGLAGYQESTLNANLDASGNGPAWGTFTTYTWFASEPAYSGTYNGTFENARLGGHFVGKGLGAFAGQHLTGDLLTADIPNVGNVIGEIKQTGP